ncbi:three component ABC system middle component [Arthrobacter sp. zg-Y916]|uniref:three component ABC system middle component n=1 Tax=Arthrobacter sp. zg-Y916 TaxID=2894190 RepID=UPI003FA42EAE
MTTRAWSSLPRDSAALFNPAFLALILGRAVQGATERGQNGIDWGESYLVIPMCLDSETRETIPRRINSSIVSWVARNPEIRSVLPQKLSGMSPLVTDGISMALHTEILLVDHGRLILGPKLLPKRVSGGTPEITAIQKTAYFLGRWFSTYPSTPGLFTLFGVRP